MTEPYSRLERGDELVYEGSSFFHMSWTPDARLMAISSLGVTLMMPDAETGFPAFPTVGMLRTAHRERRLFFRAERLEDPVRAAARDEEASPAEIDARDGWAALRRMVTRAWDQEPSDAKPMRSDDGLDQWMRGRFDGADIVARFGRLPSASTVREWLNNRGRANDRRAVDMESRSGRVPRARRFDPRIVALGQLHAVAGTSQRGRRQRVCYARFKRDVRRLNLGEPISVDGVAFAYDRPEKPLEPYGPTTFRTEWWKAKNADAAAAMFGSKGRKALYGGGGHAKEPIRHLEVVEGDDTPFPNYFLIDPYNRVPVGPCTVVFNVCVRTRCIAGWEISFDKPSASTWMRSVLHVSEPKEVPERYRERFPGLADICGYVTGAYLFDNALQNIARAVEDAGGDLCHEVRIAGEGEPTHKAIVERTIETVQTYMEEVPGSSFDIPHMNKYGYDPEKHVVITIDMFRIILLDAIATYHVTSHAGLDGRSPLDVWQELVGIYGARQAHDQDQFIRSIGSVDFVTFDRTGCWINGLRYTAGDNAELLADMAAAFGPPKNPKTQSYRVKVKFYDDDLSFVSIFDPLTRRYVHLDCAYRRYATDLPLWLHRRITEFARIKRAAFATEEEMEEARIGFSDVISQIAPEADARQRRLTARALDKPANRRRLGPSLRFMRVKPSATGMESDVVVEHDLRTSSRKDALVQSPRPKRGGENLHRAELDDAEEIAALEAMAAPRRRRTRGEESGRTTSGGRRRQASKTDGKTVPAASRPLPTGTFE